MVRLALVLTTLDPLQYFRIMGVGVKVNFAQWLEKFKVDPL